MSAHLRQPTGWRAAACALALLVGCQLVVDLDKLSDADCGSGYKACPAERTCSRVTDPAKGCANPDTCAPCLLPHATAECGLDGQCRVAACVGDWFECQQTDPRDGCETDLAHDPNNCNECGLRCSTDNGLPGCSMRRCATGGCNEGFDDCDRNPDNGCETDLRTTTNSACPR